MSEAATSYRPLADTGYPQLLTNMIHEIDILRYLLGDVKRVYVEQGDRTRPYGPEETLAVTMSFVNGCVGTFVMTE